MAWFRVDDTFPMNIKAVSCSLNAIGLWTLAGAWSCQQLTDGFIPRSIVEAFASRVLEAKPEGASIASELVDCGLWDEADGGYRFHDWSDYQFTAKEVAALREKRSEAGRKGGIKSGQTRRSKREASASEKKKQTGSKNEPHPIPSHPIITKEDKPSLVGAKAHPTKKRATSIPESWAPNDGHSKLALEHGVQLLTEASKFRDHAQANGRTLKDWDAGFRNWLRKAGEYKKRDNQHGRFGTAAFAGVNPFGGPDDNPF